MIYGITPIKDSSALDQRYEFITAKNSGIFVCGAKANYCLDSNQISWTANIIYLLLCWIIPPLRFPKGPFPPPSPCLYIQHKEDRNFCRTETSPRGLGRPREEVLSVEKSVLELDGEKFSLEREESHIFMDKWHLSCIFSCNQVLQSTLYPLPPQHSAALQSSFPSHIFPILFITSLTIKLTPVPPQPSHVRNKQ